MNGQHLNISSQGCLKNKKGDIKNESFRISRIA